MMAMKVAMATAITATKAALGSGRVLPSLLVGCGGSSVLVGK